MKLKRIDKNNIDDCIKCIFIVNKYLTKNTSINSNELVYWVEHYNKSFEDKLYCYAITEDDNIIGYFQYVHFKDKFIFIDYLVIEEEHRNKEIFKIIENELKDKSSNIIVESDNELKQHDSIVRLYKMLGFKKFDIDYIEPKLDVILYYSTYIYTDVPSTLMYIGDTNLEMYDILKTVYVDHYFRWYSLYDIDFTEYTNHLKNLISL
ncbi:GNAT family N-acetyltransferase [bacterium]|nr:GNAT family N-acetyltransferase [bacterium]